MITISKKPKKRFKRKKKSRFSIKKVNKIFSVNMILITSIIIAFILIEHHNNYPFNLKYKTEVIDKKIETKVLNLISVEGCYVGFGYIEGEGYYILNTGNENILNKLVYIPEKDTKIHLNSNKFKVDITKTTKTIKINKNRKKEEANYEFEVYIPNEKIKDYGVIKDVNNFNGFMLFPFFYYF
ncbi:MAG: hypothetical protein ACOCRX_01385 [Candidatus Woesearchaeota archaeon]